MQLSRIEREELCVSSCWKGTEVEAEYSHPVCNVAIALGTNAFSFITFLEFHVPQGLWSCQ